MRDNEGMAVGPQIAVLAPRFSRIVSVLIAAICALTAVSLVQYGHADLLLRATPALVLVAFGTYTLFWAPLVRITPEKLEVINPLRTYRVAWPAVKDITARWALTVTTESGEFSAWAAPAQGPWASVGRMRRDALGRPSLGAEGSDSVAGGSAPGIASLVVSQWVNYRDERSARDDDVSVRWHVITIAVLAVFAVLTVAGVVWP